MADICSLPLPKKMNTDLDLSDEEEELYEENPVQLFEHHRIKVDPGQSPVRIDKFLTEKIANATRNKVQTGIDGGLVKVNNEPTKSNYKVKPGDVISVLFSKPPRDEDIIPEDIPLDIVYEDADLLVVNKPAGMVVHPAYGNWIGTLVNALVYHFEQLPTTSSLAQRPGLVHRIDKDTSGLLVVAKTEPAMVGLARQFFYHTIKRTYTALVWGEVEQDSGTIRVPLGRSLKDRRLVEPVLNGTHGKIAITHYKVLERMRYVTLIECVLETGRTHQIRAHMKHLGHTLFSDQMYGGNKILAGQVFSSYKAFVENCFAIMPRQALHARSLGFIHPTTGKEMFFEQALPDDFTTVLEKWRGYVRSH